MYVIGTDIGGTFTDCAVVDEGGAIATFSKSPSTPHDPALGVMNVLEVVAADLGLSRQELLTDTALFIHGTTIATNAMIERKGVSTGLITSKGHEDTIEIGRVAHKVAGLSEEDIIHESKLHKPEPPVITRRNVVGVAERLDPRGQVVIPLNEQQVLAAAEELAGRGVQAVAVCLLYSYLNSGHEQRTAELISQRFPELFLATSNQIAPLMGEYERAITTVLTCYLGPKVAAYVERLEEALKAEGFGRRLLLMHAGGGVTTPVETKKKPLLLLDSGPVGGSLGSRFFGGAYGEPNVICTDMGGTSFDVSIIIDGQFHKADEAVIDQYRVLQPKVEIATIGSGGGSIVWLDEDGVLHVGPESAGAVPGPACYAAGGTRPTVTDADVMLGYLNPDYFLGGRVKLNAGRAREAFRPIAEAMNVTVEQAALGATRVVNAQMADAIRRDTIEKGLDPRQFVVFSYGGAGSAHAAFFGRDLHVKSVYIPRQATVFSALGMVTADVVNSAERSVSAWLPLNEQSLASLNAVLADLEAQVTSQFASAKIDAKDVAISRQLFMKYGLQVHRLAVNVSSSTLRPEDQEAIRRDFQAEYERLYGRGAGYERAGVEIVKCSVSGSCAISTPRIGDEAEAAGADCSPAVKGERPAVFEAGKGAVPTKVLDGGKLQCGNVVSGPAIIERPGDTVVVPPGVSAYVDRYLNIRIDLG